MTETPHIAVSYQEDLPAQIIEEFTQAVEKGDLHFAAEVRPRVPYASFEWAVPTLAVVFIFRSYFDAFLKEAGKDHYVILKTALGQLIKRLMGSEPEKRQARRSLIFSIRATTRDGVPIKFIFPEGVPHEAYELIISSLLDALNDHHHNKEQDHLSELLMTENSLGGTYYLEYSPKLGGWIALDWRAEAKKGQAD